MNNECLFLLFSLDSNNLTVVGIYILCGILLLLFILIVVVDVNKYQR